MRLSPGLAAQRTVDGTGCFSTRSEDEGRRATQESITTPDAHPRRRPESHASSARDFLARTILPRIEGLRVEVRAQRSETHDHDANLLLCAREVAEDHR
jgi:hypothetical protein